MADLTAADVTVTINDRDQLSRGRRVHDVTLVWGNGVDTYPAGGVPLPNNADPRVTFGLSRNVDVVEIAEALVETGFLYRYDPVAHTILAYESGTASAAFDERDGSTDVPASGTGVRVMARGR